ncbi:lipase secretion chaperone [Aquabacterium sp.]|uniref:lipase secretion chaperone n=1 Tax=Aquabacterium sp. TaxID=1872578 RepID=UPI0026371936|nr:lipase secretion chaperone [Aquabacterium sp.]MDD2976752.1 lipase secretion chaperone [Aquabacterium sp.]
MPENLEQSSFMHNGITLTNNARTQRIRWFVVSAVVAALGVYGVQAWLDDAATTTSFAAHQAAPAEPGIIQPTPAPSLVGTAPDGTLHDGRGDLRLSPDLIRRFDYWLTTYGEKSLEAIQADILADLRDELNASGMARAQQVLKAYFAYKNELARLTPLPAGTQQAAALSQQLKAMRDVRARHFQPSDIAQLFGPDDAQDEETLARLHIMQDAALSDADKQRKLAELTAQLPPEQQAHRTEPVLHLTVSEAVAEARERGASDQEVQAVRTQLVGADAAQRLAVLDAEEAAWQARVQQYLSLRQTDEVAAEAYKEANFKEREKLRLSAYSSRRPS